MTAEFVISLAGEAIKLVLTLSLPLLGVGLAVGLFVAVIQATTQIQETTLSFVPKIISVLMALILAGPWMLNKLSQFTTQIITSIPQVIR